MTQVQTNNKPKYNNFKELKTALKEKDELIQELQAEITDLKQKLEAVPTKIRNERKAGRKPKITKEMTTEFLALQKQGYSSAEIAKIYTQNTGKIISKSTVYKSLNLNEN